MRFPSLEEVTACNEAVREPDEISRSADDDDIDQVARALDRARVESDPIDAAASLAFELTSAQAFYEWNKRTAALIARWFIRTNTGIEPDRIIKPDDHEFGDLLIAAARVTTSVPRCAASFAAVPRVHARDQGGKRSSGGSGHTWLR